MNWKINLVKCLALAGGVVTGGLMILDGDVTNGLGIVLASFASASGFQLGTPVK